MYLSLFLNFYNLIMKMAVWMFILDQTLRQCSELLLKPAWNWVTSWYRYIKVWSSEGLYPPQSAVIVSQHDDRLFQFTTLIQSSK